MCRGPTCGSRSRSRRELLGGRALSSGHLVQGNKKDRPRAVDPGATPRRGPSAERTARPAACGWVTRSRARPSGGTPVQSCPSRSMNIAIVGGGIGGLTLALALHQRGLDCCVYESAPEVRELGVGITLLPHAMRELTALGLGDALVSQGSENRESFFFNRFGQLIYSEPRGRTPGY